jgi:pimeloyl-ACP methyl ester carboxylesterase
VSPAPVLLLHAFPLDARMWEAQSDILERAGYDVLAPNLPGQQPESDLARWAERVLQLAPERFVAVGCSMGGYLIFELWRQAASRLAAAAFIDTRAGADTPEARRGRQDTICLLQEDGFDAFWERTQRPRLFGPDAAADVVARARAIAAEQPVANLVATLEALGARPDSRDTAMEIDVPALVLVGQQDVLTPPSEAEELAGLLPQARVTVIADAGHLTPLERADEVNEELIVFLSHAAA